MKREKIELAGRTEVKGKHRPAMSKSCSDYQVDPGISLLSRLAAVFLVMGVMDELTVS